MVDPDRASTHVAIPAGSIQVRGDVTHVADPRGLVIFVHGSGSSRSSVRNRQVAQILNRERFVTLLADLLTAQEDAVDARIGGLRFDIPMLATRTAAMIDWARSFGLPMGLFGASTGAAAAIRAASDRPDDVGAVVSRGGRVDLAGSSIEALRAPLLMIVGSRDTAVMEIQRAVAPRLVCEHREAIVSHASHLFEEPGTLDIVAALATQWFEEHLTMRSRIGRRSGQSGR
jgi:dienelactone hydrolase